MASAVFARSALATIRTKAAQRLAPRKLLVVQRFAKPARARLGLRGTTEEADPCGAQPE
jgi:hypothetical protein